jgi:hypothetical protein
MTDSLRLGGKLSLPPRRTSGPIHRDTGDIVSGVVRQLRAVGRRLAQEDADGLEHLRLIQSELDEVWTVVVPGLRRAGHTDGEIGAVLGITRQAVQQRWPREKGNA